MPSRSVRQDRTVWRALPDVALQALTLAFGQRRYRPRGHAVGASGLGSVAVGAGASNANLPERSVQGVPEGWVRLTDRATEVCQALDLKFRPGAERAGATASAGLAGSDDAKTARELQRAAEDLAPVLRFEDIIRTIALEGTANPPPVGRRGPSTIAPSGGGNARSTSSGRTAS